MLMLQSLHVTSHMFIFFFMLRGVLIYEIKKNCYFGQKKEGQFLFQG